MQRRRTIVLAVSILVMLSLLTGRLVQIQLTDTEHFSKHEINLIEASVKQRSQELTINDGRGTFFDRNGRPLGHEEVPALVLFPFLKKMEWPSAEIARITGISEQMLMQALEDAEKPFAMRKDGKVVRLTKQQSEAINTLQIPGVFAVAETFKSAVLPAAQLLGSTVQYSSLAKKRYPERELSADTRVGYNGLQRSFDEFLLSDGESKLIYHVDGTGGPLFGVDVKYTEPANPLYPVRIITTIDRNLQAKAEALTDKYKIKKGGLLLLDIETSEIAALVSRPSYDPANPAGEGSVNYMFRQKAPGSVFKTVVAAAAIDYNLTGKDRTFDCSLAIDGVKASQRELGTLDFQSGFAQSCNRTFSETAKEIARENPDFFEEYALKLGALGASGWEGDVYHSRLSQLYGEEAGMIWNGKDGEKLKKDEKMVAKTAIGQQDVQLSPLGIANMMATIARGGEKKMVKAVRRVEFNNGTNVYTFPDRSISGEHAAPYTIKKLQEMLRSVVTDPNGTGSSLSRLPYEVAGKSGTAQTNIEKKKLNKWFAGYFPYKKPKYALVAVSLDTGEAGGGMTGLFGDMVQAVYEEDGKTD